MMYTLVHLAMLLVLLNFLILYSHLCLSVGCPKSGLLLLVFTWFTPKKKGKVK